MFKLSSNTLIWTSQRKAHWYNRFSSVSCSCVSNSLWPNGLQHARRPCPLPTPRVYPNACPLSRWCHPTISSSVIPFSSRLQSSPASGSFQMSQFSASGGQNIGVSASASVLPMNIQDWSIDWLDLLAVQGTLKSLLQHHSSEASILWHSAFFLVTFLVAQMVKAFAYNVGDPASIPGSGRSPGEGNPLQYLAWKIPWMERSGRLQSTGLQRAGHDWVTSLTHSLTAFFIVQLSHPYMTNGKTIALTRWTFVGNVFAF